MKTTRNLVIALFLAMLLVGISSYASPTSWASQASPSDSLQPIPAQSVIDEVIWVVGDEAVLKSDVEALRMQAAMEGVKWSGDPDCTIPEQIAVNKLFLHQADIDSIEVTEADVAQEAEYKHQSISQMRQELRQELRDRQKIQKMKRKLVEDISVTPADVRRYFNSLPADSLPYVPTEVEVQIVTFTPRIAPEEINRVKDELRDYTERVTKGETSFQALARLYSEDPGSARQGGELGLMGRATLDPAFAAVAFNLTDPKKISKIVESEFGFHIIQLVEKRGDKVNVRHILKKPVVSDEAIEHAIGRLDSLATEIRKEQFTFEEAASLLSDDKDTRNNKGLMSNTNMQTGRISSRFQMQDLPQEVAKVVDTMQVGQISSAFQMINQRGKTVCAIVKLKNRVEGHKASITEDFQVMKDVVLAKRNEECIHQWVVDKIKSVYTRLNENYRDCKFEYEGWFK